MPEYSSTTITPADGVKVPSMNGSTSGNFLLSALKSYILAEKGQANGLASLGSDGKLTAAQLPDLADDVIVVASYAVLPAAGTAGKIYITADNNKMYRWDPDLATPDYVELSIDLSEYATKAELAEEESAREAADSNLKSAIDFNRKRIENLEQKSGSVVDVDYPDYSVTGEVPTGKAKNAIVSKMRGVTVAYNEQIKNGDFADTSNWASSNIYRATTSFTVADGVATVVGASASNGGLELAQTGGVGIIKDHRYLFSVDISADVSCTFTLVADYPNYTTQISKLFNPSITANVRAVQNVWFTGLSTITTNFRLTSSGTTNGGTFNLRKVRLYDLTQMFGSQVADYLYSIEQGTAGAGVALFKALVSAQDESHETGRLVSTTYESVGSEGRNLVQSIYQVSGSNPYAVVLFAYAELEPSTTYTISFVGANGNSLYTNEHLFNIVSIVCNGTRQSLTVTTKSEISHSNSNQYQNGKWMLFKNSGTNTVNPHFSNVQIEKGSSMTDYSPYMTDSLPLPASITLRGILKVVNNNLVVDGDEYDPETGKIERNYGIVDLGDMNYVYDSAHYRFRPSLPPSNLKSIVASEVPDVMVVGYIAVDNATYWEGNVDKVVSQNGDTIWFTNKDYANEQDPATAFKADMTGRKFIYPLATPTPDTPVDPINDPTLATEGGGTLSTEQTNDPSIVSAMEMTYLTL